LLSILIVDDHAAIRAAVRVRLESCSGFTVCGEAVDGLEAIEKARELKPDLILLDISAKPEGIDQVVECVRILLQLASGLPSPPAHPKFAPFLCRP
jgi:DNA-binding NarL/FixJ family response regulator